MSLLNRELDYFLAICETRNLARAADVLSVSQPALTRSLQRLETRLGAQLFVRAPRGVELTPIGSALRARVEKARVTLGDAEKEVEQLAAGKIGKVRIGAGNVIARLVNRALFPRFITERPAAQVQLHVAFNADLFALVEAGKLDFAVCGVPDTPPSGMDFREIGTANAIVVVRIGHPLTALKKPALRDLAAFRGVMPGVLVRTQQVVDDQLAKLGFANRPHAIESNSWEAILDAIATTDLYGIAPRHEALWHGWESRLAPIDIPEIDIKQRAGVVTRTGAYLSPLAMRAIELIELSFADLTREKPTPSARARRTSER